MDLENEKLSSRQVGRLLFYDFFALPTLLLPKILTAAVGIDGFFSLVIGALLGYLLLLLVLTWLRCMENKKIEKSRVTAWLAAGYWFLSIFAAAYAMQRLCGLICTYLIQETPVWLVMGALTILAVYGLCVGTESRGRMYELLFWFVLVPLAVLCLLSVSALEPEHWAPVAQADGSAFLNSVFVAAACFSASLSLPIYAELLADRERLGSALARSYLLGSGSNLLLFLLLTGIFGVPTVARMDDAVIQLSALAKMMGGFFERQDALLCIIWFLALFAYLENMLHAAVWSMGRLGKQQAQQWYVFGAGSIVYVLALVFYRYPSAVQVYGTFCLTLGVPFLVLLFCAALVVSKFFKSQKGSE